MNTHDDDSEKSPTISWANVGLSILLAGVFFIAIKDIGTFSEKIEFSALWKLYAAYIPYVFLCRAVLELVPKRYFYGVQTVTLILFCFWVRLAQVTSLKQGAIVVASICFYTAMLRFVSPQKRLIYSFVVIAFMFVPSNTVWLYRENPLLGHFVGILTFQFLMAFYDLKDTPKNLLLCGRSLMVLTFSVTPIPVVGLKDINRTRSTYLTGALAFAYSIFARELSGWLILQQRTFLPQFNSDIYWVASPIEVAQKGGWFVGALWTVIFCWFVVLNLSCWLFQAAGTLRVLGIRVNWPMTQPWKATNLMDFLRRGNVYVFHLLSNTFFRGLELPARGKMLFFSILSIFLVGGIYHTTNLFSKETLYILLIWIVDGIGAGLTAIWIQKTSQQDASYFIKHRRMRQRSFCTSLSMAVGGWIFVSLFRGTIDSIVTPHYLMRAMNFIGTFLS